MASTTLEQQRRRPTRHRGISYREKADGSRSYAVFFQGRYFPSGTTETEALAKQAEFRGSKARGEKPILPTKITFAQVAESWLERKAPRLRKRTADYYRSALDLVLLPRFGSWKVAAVDADAISALIRDLEQQGLHAIDANRVVRPLGRSSIENYLKPLQGILQRAVRDRLIATNPFSSLTSDDRPKREEKAPGHEWTDEDVRALLDSSAALARKPESRYDYTFLLRVVSTLGLRCGEVLGLRWADFDKDAGILHVRGQVAAERQLRAY
jgi:integrase